MHQLVSAFLFAAVFLNTQSHAQTLRQLLTDIFGTPTQPSLPSNLSSLADGYFRFLKENENFKKAEPSDITPEQDEEYDFIVVGAGSAGATIASRLTEVHKMKVLLLEAGSGEDLFMDVPLPGTLLQLSDKVNWKYQTEPSDSYCLGMTDQRCNWPRGKVMGGSSVLNYMAATRGNKRDYNRWAELGNTGWSYDEVLYCFKKMENIGIPELMSDEEMHSTTGPLPINYPPYHTSLAEGFLQAGHELGFDILDYNGRNQTGFSYMQTTTNNGERVSSSRAYLHPVRNRSNLLVSKNSLVSKVLIDESENRAVGVEFVKGNKQFTARARKEVILCAGTIGSAQLLMLSGVGPADHLAEMGIPLIKDAPVGKNLMDHITFGGFIGLIDEPAEIILKDVFNPLNGDLSHYFDHRQGPLTVPVGCEAIAFFNVDTPQDHTSWPNVEVALLSVSIVADENARLTYGISNSLWGQVYEPIIGRHAWQIFPILLRPLSRGEILLNNTDIKTPPRIIANYMSDPEDIRIMIAGIRAAQNITETKSMQRFGSKLYDTPLPGCEKYQFDSDDYWECAARTLTFPIYHHSGTAKMGPANDPTAVVNSRLQVYGVERLRVADASIMPEIPTAHTNIPVIMIAEKLSDMVKEDWGLNYGSMKMKHRRKASQCSVSSRSVSPPLSHARNRDPPPLCHSTLSRRSEHSTCV